VGEFVLDNLPDIEYPKPVSYCQAKGDNGVSRKYWLGFNLVRGIGPMKVRALLDYFGDLQAAWGANEAALRQAGLDRRALSSLLKVRARLDLDAEMEKVAAQNIQVLTWDDPDYPPRLLQIPDPPPLIYVRGQLTADDEWAVAVVGTRRASAYGRTVTQRIVTDLAVNHMTIVSGLARGIDAEAHRVALKAGGRTIAVLGCGLDLVYPPEHRNLAREVVARGALVSEYPLETRPEAKNFPPRNRIISGLSLGVLVIEAGLRSGALITADYAADQGRDVFAVPGNLFVRSSMGTNRLIQDGARLATGAEDVLEELNLTMVAQQAQVRAVVPETESEARLLQYLSLEPVHVDELCRQVELPIAQVTSNLALMELKGMVRQVGGMNYVLMHEPSVTYRVD
jgi:DNA processing protein